MIYYLMLNPLHWNIKHTPCLCWVYSDDIQQEFIGINTCAVDMLKSFAY